MNVMARIALALVALMTISACVIDDGGRDGWGRDHERGDYR